MGNILTAMGAPVAQQAINNTMTEMEERPYREEARTNRMAMDKMTLEKAQIEMKNIKEREAFLEQKVNFGQTLREKGELHENTIQYGEKGFKNLGIIDESGMISRKNLGRAAMEMENQEKVMKNVFKYDLEQRTADMDKAWNKFEKINKEDSGATQQEKIDAKKTYEEAKRLESVAAGRIGKIDKHYETKKEMREILQDLKSDPEFKKLVFSDPTLQGKVQTAIKLNDPTLLRQVVAKAFEQSGKPEKQYEPHQYVDKNGKPIWVEPGQTPPPGAKPYVAPAQDKTEKLTMTDVKSAYSMDIGNIKNQMMVDMAPDEQANITNQPDTNILAMLLSGKIGKSLSPEKKKVYIDKLQELEKYYGDLTNQVLGRKGAKIPDRTPSVPPSASLGKDLINRLRGGDMSNQPVPFAPKTETSAPKAKTRGEATKILKDNGYPETEANIKALMGK